MPEPHQQQMNPLFKNAIIALILLLMCAPILQSLFKNGDMLRTDDGILHLYRVIALEHSLRVDDAIWPRYSSGLVYGFGAPLYNYFPPTSYYPAVFFYWLGVGFVQSWKLMMALLVLVAAGGAFALGRVWKGDIAGLVSATAYVYAPYLLFNVFTRGTSSELAGIALLPWALWGFSRLALYGKRFDFFCAVMSFALFIPMHNIVTVHGTLMLMILCAFLWLSSKQRVRTFLQLFTAGVVAVAISAYFWLPALGETSATKVTNVAEALDFIDPAASLRPITEILALPHTYDPTQQQQQIPIVLAWPQIVLASIGLLLALWRKSDGWPLRSMMLALLTITVLTTIAQLPFAARVWELPLLNFSQFSWRIMGVPSLALAMLSGIGAALMLDRIGAQSRKIAAVGVFSAVIVIYSTPWLYTAYFRLPADSITDAQNYERESRELTLSSYSEYLPVQANAETLDPDKLADRFAESDIIPRLQDNAAVRVLSQSWRGTSAMLRVDVAAATRLIFDWLYFPDWSATINGERINVAVELPQGFVSIDVPAGTHDIYVGLQNTRLQNLSHIISFMALLSFVVIVWIAPRFWQMPINSQQAEASSWRMMATVALIGLAFMLLKMALIDSTQNMFKRARLVDGQIQNVENALTADFSGQIRLLGYEVINRVKSGESAQISLFWTLAGDSLNTDYSTSLHLRDARGNLIAETGTFTPGGTATSNWIPGQYLEERLTLEIPHYTPPADYTLDVSLYDATTLAALAVIDVAGNPTGQRVPLDTIQVTLPDTQPSWEQAPFGTLGNMDLLTINGLPERAAAGDEITLAWTWRMNGEAPPASEAILRWSNRAEGTDSAHSQIVAFVPDIATEDWQSGAIWRGTHRIFVPGDLQREGRYLLHVALTEDHTERIELGAVDVMLPQRNYDAVSLKNSSDLAWQNGIILRSYEQRDSALIFNWGTSAVLRESYRLFVQLVDSDERIVAISDGIPVNWTRPTSSWDVGEVILTEHDFSAVVEGGYRVRVGWYEPRSGHRVMLETGEDSAILPVDFVVVE